MSNIMEIEVDGMTRKSAMKEEKKRMNRGSLGFTLVELIVVLVILSVLSAVAVPSVLGYIDDSKAKECRTQVEALTAEISSAKMAYEANGEVSESGEVGREFGKDQIDAYIAAAGDEGRCPVDDVLYEYKQEENKIVCPKGHGEGVISNSGKFTVAVAEDTDKREDPDEVLPPKDDENDSGEKSKLDLVVPSVTVKKGGTGMLNPEGVGGSGKYTYSFKSVTPEKATVDADGTVHGLQAGTAQIEVTVTDTETNETVTKNVLVTVESDLDVQVPESQAVGVKQTKPLGEVTPKGGSGSYKVTYKSLTPDKVSVDSETGEITGVESGDGMIEVTVTDTETNETVTKNVPVTVMPELDVQVPEGQSVDVNEKKPLGEVTPKGGSGNYEVTYESMTPDIVSVDRTTGEITGNAVGDNGRVRVTVTDNETGATVTKEVPVMVTNPKIEPPTEPQTDSPLELKVPPLSVEEGKTGQLKPETTGGSGDYTYEYRSLKPETATVDENGTVRGKNVGKTKVEVTVTDNKTKEKKTVTVEVEVTKSGGLFNPKEFQLWAHDNAGIDLFNYTEDPVVRDQLLSIFSSLPSGKWYDETGRYFDVFNPNNPGEGYQLKVFPARSGINGFTGPFTLRFKADDGREDTLTFTVGYPIISLQEPYKFSENGDEVVITTVMQPEWTTDVPLEWEVESTGSVNVEWEPADEKCVRIKVRKSSEGVCDFKVRARRLCQKTGQYVESVWANFSISQKAPLAENQVLIDDHRFGATSWEEFRKRVEDKKGESYQVNYHRGEPDGDTTILLYDVDKDTGERILYVVNGNEEDFSTTNTPVEYDSFASFIKGNKLEKKFTEVSFSPENIICIESYDELETAESMKGGYPAGTIAKVKNSSGGYDYYIAYDSSEKKTQLSCILYGQIGDDAKKKNGWWKLEVLL